MGRLLFMMVAGDGKWNPPQIKKKKPCERELKERSVVILLFYDPFGNDFSSDPDRSWFLLLLGVAWGS